MYHHVALTTNIYEHALSARHFICIISDFSLSCVYSYPHLTDEESESWVDYFIFVSGDHTANEAGPRSH